MKQKRLKSCILLVFGLASLEAQVAVTASGGESSGSGGTSSYSVGQVAYKAHTGTNGSVSEGVLQAYEISVVEGLDEAKGIKLMVSAYPNPTTDYLNLKVEKFDNANWSYKLYTLNGKLLGTKKIENKKTSIVMSNLKPATYFLKVSEGNKEVKTFKIIKN